MDTDEHEPRKISYDFSREILDGYSVDDLTDRIEQLRAEISRCESEVLARQSTRMAADGFFKT